MEHVAKVDRYFFYSIINITRKHKLSHCALQVSATGDGPLYVYLSVAILFGHSHGQAFFNLLLLSFMVELPLYLLFKNTIRRQRPCYAFAGFTNGFYPSDKFSLPSGHTAAAFVFASVCYQFMPSLSPIAYSWAVAVGLSRVALGVHYPLDIVAGIGLGMCSVRLAEQVI